MDRWVLIGWLLGSFSLTACLTTACVWLAYRPPSSALERRMKARINQLELEWSDTFERLNSLVGRITKRQGLDRKQDADTEPANGQVRATEGRPTGGARAQLFRKWKQTKGSQHAK